MTRNFFGDLVNWLTAIYFVAFGILLVLTNHGDLVLWINERHSPSLDFFLKYWTYLGDGVLLGVLGLILLLTNYYRFLVFMLGVVLQTVFVHLFKQWLYANEPRPKAYFAEIIDSLHFVEGVAVRSYDSFPSGHTASGFLLFYFLITLIKNSTLRVLCFITAVGVGLSRIYLFQHFGRDVFIGGLFGVISVMLAYLILDKYQGKSNLQRGLLNR